MFNLKINHAITLNDSFIFKDNKIYKKNLYPYYANYSFELKNNQKISEAFNLGFLPNLSNWQKNNWNFPNIWEAIRSVRLNVKDYKIDYSYNNKLNKNNYKIINSRDINDSDLLNNYMSSIDDIYYKYLDYKKFNEDINFKDIKIDNDFFLLLCLNENNELCAYDVCYQKDNILFTPGNAWDYEKPKLSILSIFYLEEINYCIKNNINYIYTGEGYYYWGIYKSNKKGFEWWTGSEWSTDKEQYIELCKKDEEIE